MKVTFTLSIGYSNAKRKEVVEYEDDVTDEELEKDWQDWSANYIDGSFEREEN